VEYASDVRAYVSEEEVIIVREGAQGNPATWAAENPVHFYSQSSFRSKTKGQEDQR